jgi:hypothetical protein
MLGPLMSIICKFLLQSIYSVHFSSPLWLVLNFKPLHSGEHLDASFSVNIFKNKINCRSVMDTAGLHEPTEQIRLSTFHVSNVSRLSPSWRCATAANIICRSLDVFDKHTVSFRTRFLFLSHFIGFCYLINVLSILF